MHAKIRKNRILAVVMMAFCLLVVNQMASAQSPMAAVFAGRPIDAASKGQNEFRACKEVKGLWIDVTNDMGGTTGTITNGGILNGKTESVYDAAFVFTPDPNVVSYIADLIITTRQGRLSTSNVYIYNFATGLWTAMGRINTDKSTGRFAGATGVLYFNGKTTEDGLTYISNVSGETCFAD